MKVPAKSAKDIQVSRTVLVNVLIIIAGCIPIVLRLPQLAVYAPYALVLSGIIGIVLRTLRDNPVDVPDPTVTVDRTPDPKGPIV